MKRSRHLGVYHNYDNDLPYRVAIKRFVQDDPIYKHIGYFQHEDTAAWVYNVHALSRFGTGAVINTFDASQEVEDEMALYSCSRPNFLIMLEEAIELLEDPGNAIKRNRHT